MLFYSCYCSRSSSSSSSSFSCSCSSSSSSTSSCCFRLDVLVVFFSLFLLFLSFSLLFLFFLSLLLLLLLVVVALLLSFSRSCSSSYISSSSSFTASRSRSSVLHLYLLLVLPVVVLVLFVLFCCCFCRCSSYSFLLLLLVHHYHLHHHHHLLLVSFLDSFLFPAQAHHWNLWTRLVITSYPSDRDLSTVLIYATFKIYWWPQGLGASSKEFESREPAGKEIFLIQLFFKEIRKASEVHQTHLSLHSFHLFYKHIHQRDLHVSLQWSITWNHSLQFYYVRVRHIQRFGIAKRNHYVKSLGLCKVAQTVDALLPNLPWDLKLLTSCMLILNVLGGNRCKKSCPSCFCRKTKIDGRTLPRLTRS